MLSTPVENKPSIMTDYLLETIQKVVYFRKEFLQSSRMKTIAKKTLNIGFLS